MNATIIILAILIMVIVLLIYRFLKVNRRNKKLQEERYERIKELHIKIKEEKPLTQEDIFPYADNLLLREPTYDLLRTFNKTDLFPKEFYTIVKGAESNLANWLEFPTELDSCPDEIEHITRETIDYDGQKNFVHYEVFKYRVNAPHWASENGWMLGVVGPYFDDSNPYDHPHATFSRVSSTINNTTTREEAKWVHENISMRN